MSFVPLTLDSQSAGNFQKPFLYVNDRKTNPALQKQMRSTTVPQANQDYSLNNPSHFHFPPTAKQWVNQQLVYLQSPSINQP